MGGTVTMPLEEYESLKGMIDDLKAEVENLQTDVSLITNVRESEHDKIISSLKRSTQNGAFPYVIIGEILECIGKTVEDIRK